MLLDGGPEAEEEEEASPRKTAKLFLSQDTVSCTAQ
jgi:hypothetical protein